MDQGIHVIAIGVVCCIAQDSSGWIVTVPVSRAGVVSVVIPIPVRVVDVLASSLRSGIIVVRQAITVLVHILRVTYFLHTRIDLLIVIIAVC